MEEKKTWLGKILIGIISIFISNWPKFVANLWPKVPKELQEKVSIVIKVVENIKNFVDSPLADLIVLAIPGDADEEIRKKLSELLEQVLHRWNETGIEDKINPVYLHGLGATLTSELTGMSFGQSAITTEVAYQAFKKEQNS